VCYCDICGLAFQRMSEIIRHMRTHTGEKPFACEVCKKAFCRRSQVTVHMRTHTGKKPLCV
jgi:KRAB domain-containing zinc finger protein